MVGSDIRISRGETSEGLFWILVFQDNKVEFRCQHLEIWLPKELGMILEDSASVLTLEEIKTVIKDWLK